MISVLRPSAKWLDCAPASPIGAGELTHYPIVARGPRTVLASRAMKKTVCITGGAGFIGSHVADAFAARGDRVIVIDDLSGGRRSNVPPPAEFHQLDVRSREAAELVEGSRIDLLVHQAAQMDVRRSVADPVFDADVNVVGSLNLFEAARRGGIRQVLFAGDEVTVQAGAGIVADSDPQMEFKEISQKAAQGIAALRAAAEETL